MTRDELINFLQWLSYYGGEASLTIGGLPISRPQAAVLADAYFNRKAGA